MILILIIKGKYDLGNCGFVIIEVIFLLMKQLILQRATSVPAEEVLTQGNTCQKL